MSEFDADAYIEASLPLLGMELSAPAHAAVKLHLETAERLSRLVLNFALDDDVEPAPVFRA